MRPNLPTVCAAFYANQTVPPISLSSNEIENVYKMNKENAVVN